MRVQIVIDIVKMDGSEPEYDDVVAAVCDMELKGYEDLALVEMEELKE